MRELPNEFMAYYRMMLCLYRDVSQQEVLRVMADGLHWLFGLKELKITGKSEISQARARVRAVPLIDVFERCAMPLAKAGSMGSFYRGRRLIAMDGSDKTESRCESLMMKNRHHLEQFGHYFRICRSAVSM
jgi:hypothetical protein